MKRGRTKHLDFICGDILALELSYLTAAFLVRTLWPKAEVSWNLQQGISMIFIMFTVIFFTEGYKDILSRGYLKEMLAVIRQNRGLANKELARFADQINALCDKYSRK